MMETHRTTTSDLPECWPPLPLEEWKDTYATLHMWTQIVGKVRMALTPKTNHFWNVPFYGTSTRPDHLGDPLREAHLRHSI